MAARICYRLITVFIERLRATNEQAREAIRWGLRLPDTLRSTTRSLSDANLLDALMADPAKLELLTRPAGEAGFQIFEIDSHHVYWAHKPRRLPQTEWEVTAQPTGADGARHFVLKNLRQDSYLLLSSKEYYLWEYFDGRHSLEEIARAFTSCLRRFRLCADPPIAHKALQLRRYRRAIRHRFSIESSRRERPALEPLVRMGLRENGAACLFAFPMRTDFARSFMTAAVFCSFIRSLSGRASPSRFLR